MTQFDQDKFVQVAGGYNLRVTFTNMRQSVNIDPQTIQSFTITQDLYSFLPTLRMAIPSAGEQYIHLITLDKIVKISVDIGHTEDIQTGGNSFNFLVYRCFPRSNELILDVEALLDVKNLFDTTHIRGFTGLVSDTLKTISYELGLQSGLRKDSAQKRIEKNYNIISSTLNYQKNLVQANQTNAALLSYLQNNLEGRNSEGCYYCNLFNRSGKTYFRFTTLEELLREPIKLRLCYGSWSLTEEEQTDNYIIVSPIWEYEIVENYRLENLFGGEKTEYNYFDYSTGTYKQGITSAADFYSLTKKFLIVKDDPSGIGSLYAGRTNTFSSNFIGKAKGRHYKSLINLVRLKVTTYGVTNLVPGDLVKLIFMQPVVPEHQQDFMHQGSWLVERVTHSFGLSYTTELILTRNGIDTTLDTSLVAATREKK
jgi:hypothetical protein